MKLGELFDHDAIGAADGEIEITGITADSRAVTPGALFAALPGASTNGVKFAEDAVTRGAAAILTDMDTKPELSRPVPVIADENPRRRLALIASKFYKEQPDCIVAVTGTNGKTSVAAFVRQIWQAMGLKAASLGTVGVVSPTGDFSLTHTTPDPVALHKILADLKSGGVDHLALEASSHGLAQHRLDGVRVAAAGFTNITRDHLDYHQDFESYLAAKLRLFSDIVQPGGTAVIHSGQIEALDVAAACQFRGLQIMTVGRFGLGIKLVKAVRDGLGQKLTLRHQGKTFTVSLPLTGEFQTENALVAAALVLSQGGVAPDAVFAALEALKGAKGRMELAGRSKSGAPVFIDYAHTPDALQKALVTLRPYASGKLTVVFGCGGDRDRGKRAQMGAIAAAMADRVVITDDNPRSEDAAAIRREILAAAPGAQETGDRATAIREAINMLAEGDVLLIAGKGHETGQIIGTETLPYSDHAAVASVLGDLAPEPFAAAQTGSPSGPKPADEPPPPPQTPPASETKPLPGAQPEPEPEPAATAPVAEAPLLPEVRQADGDTAGAAQPEKAVERDQPAEPLPAAAASLAASAEPAATIIEMPAKTAKPAVLWTLADVLAAIKGSPLGKPAETASGVSIDSRTLSPGDIFFAIKGERFNGHDFVGAALEKGAAFAVVARDYFGAAGPLVRVPDPLEALNALAGAARARSGARIIAVTGSAGKTSSKEMLRMALAGSGAVHASDKSYNNLWGVPLSLARMPVTARFGVFEIGMNHAGEITPLSRLVRPHIAIITTVAPVHLEFFADVAAIAEAKAEIFHGLEPEGIAILNADNEHFELLCKRAGERGAARVIAFGAADTAEAKLISAEAEGQGFAVKARVLGESLSFKLAAPGRHLALNSLAVLAAVKLSGADLAMGGEALSAFLPPEGRGVRETFALPLGEVVLIDESYNANPASMQAALATLGELMDVGVKRRVAVLGDMLELGHAAQELHLKLKAAIDEAKVDVVFACGHHMKALYDALPAARQAGYALASEDLKAAVLAAVSPGDAVMIKGSLGSRMGQVVSALRDHLRVLAEKREKRAQN